MAAAMGSSRILVGLFLAVMEKLTYKVVEKDIRPHKSEDQQW
jgi:hypothetical protein